MSTLLKYFSLDLQSTSEKVSPWETLIFFSYIHTQRYLCNQIRHICLYVTKISRSIPFGQRTYRDHHRGNAMIDLWSGKTENTTSKESLLFVGVPFFLFYISILSHLPSLIVVFPSSFLFGSFCVTYGYFVFTPTVGTSSLFRRSTTLLPTVVTTLEHMFPL